MIVRLLNGADRTRLIGRNHETDEGVGLKPAPSAFVFYKLRKREIGNGEWAQDALKRIPGPFPISNSPFPPFVSPPGAVASRASGTTHCRSSLPAPASTRARGP